MFAPSSNGPASTGRTLWTELADGTAGPVVRILITLVLAAALSGGCLVAAYALAAAVPAWDRSFQYNWGPGWSAGNRPSVYPTDELLATLFAIASAAFLAAEAWLWSRNTKNTKHRALWYAAVMTLVLAVVTGAACALVVNLLGGDEELVVGGVVCLAAAAVLLMWVQVWRCYGRGRAARNEADGRLDVRCPACGYRMVGLHESRCPECGTLYTLDELLTKQNFDRRGGVAAATYNQPPPPLRPPPTVPDLPPIPHKRQDVDLPAAEHPV